MRTTITLDADTQALIEKAMRERDLSFKDVVNHAIRSGLAGSRKADGHYTTPRALGTQRTDITKALSLAGGLEDEAITGDLAVGR